MGLPINLIPIRAVVLAAGVSSRMGKFKPLLPIDGKPMLEIVLTKVLSFPFQKVLAVVGYKGNELKEAINLEDDRFNWIINEQFSEGLSTSIKAAIRFGNNETKGVLIFLGDQPLLRPSTIDQILEVIIGKGLAQSKCIVQPTFNGTPGHPVFISASMIPYLKTITGDQGAKPIFKFADHHIYVPINDEWTVLDVDTNQDYQNIVNHSI
ncbi:molybdenum cofactor cytidylyltransferase [Neobacillus bataviensis]|uniref:Molybdenum cofactor cytidylyltransferase n=1 Tax=Neobacillus bataviensis TaxID=220685 RepID=A0A561CU30_9BACI|nr:nucleotidyltransferase family protein [Neobacillus bataviensis]TWD94594.1 molybdenum cofactor cytidylyltransferase [Neobacillus bataviensis]